MSGTRFSVLLLFAAALAPLSCEGREPSAAPLAAAEPEVPTPPPTYGLDEALVAGAFERADDLRLLQALLVARHGEIEREQVFRGPGLERPTNIKSASKSIISALVGIAIAEGHLSGVDEPITSFLKPTQRTDPGVAEITIGHLLSMQAGLEPTSFGNYGRWVSSSNWVRFALERPMVDEPGGRMLYSTGNTHLLSAILTQATGQSTLSYARQKLGRTLGLQVAPWTRDPQGIYFGGNEMGLSPRDLFKFGELYRNGGRHEDQQVLPEEWIRESWRRRTTSDWSGHDYGLGWWMRTSGRYDVFFAWGYGGQYVFIVPDLELTVVTTSESLAPRERGHNRALHRLLDEWIIPAAEAGEQLAREDVGPAPETRPAAP
ncbi:MAG: serine hydrolase [Acidobacteriota bacterium]